MGAFLPECEKCLLKFPCYQAVFPPGITLRFCCRLPPLSYKDNRMFPAGNVLSNLAIFNNLLPLCVGGKKEERPCCEWEVAYSSGKDANEVQRLWKTNAIALNIQIVTAPVFHTILARNLLAAFQSGRNSFCLEFLVLFVPKKNYKKITTPSSGDTS